jgi:hypothetical protein
MDKKINHQRIYSVLHKKDHTLQHTNYTLFNTMVKINNKSKYNHLPIIQQVKNHT